MRRAWKWALVAVAAIVVLAIAALAAAPYLVDTPRIQSLIASTVSQALGRPVKFADVSVSVFPLPAVVLKDLEVAEDPAFGRGPFLRLNQAEVRLRLWPLLLLRVELGEFVLKKPIISLVQSPDGRWNIASLGTAPDGRAPSRPRGSGGGAGAGAVLGSRVMIQDGVVTYETRAGGATTRYRVEGLDLTLASGGHGVLRFTGDATVKPGDLELKIAEGTVALEGARALMDAPLRARVTLDGKQIRELVALSVGPEPVIEGAVKGTVALGGSVGSPRATGEVVLSNVKLTDTHPQCPEPKKRTLSLGDVQVNLAWQETRFAARPVTMSLGKGNITTNVTATIDRGVRVELGELGAKTLPIEKILVDFLCQGYAVTGPMDLSGTASLKLGDMWRTLNGRGQFRIGPGKVVGSQALALLSNLARVAGAVSSLLGGDLPLSGFASALEYDAIQGTYTVTNGVVQTRDLLFKSRLLNMAVAGTYALASGAMNLDVGLTAGQTELKGKVTGTAANPVVRVAPPNLREFDPAKVERGLRDLLKQFR